MIKGANECELNPAGASQPLTHRFDGLLPHHTCKV